MKPIETEYKGYRFRSRLEARWAIFFDSLGFTWEYEPEGYDIDGTWYLPDFYIPHLGLIIEIKPQTGDPEWEDHIILDYISKRTNDKTGEHTEEVPNFIILKGTPALYGFNEYKNPKFGYIGIPWGDTHYYWCECTNCGMIGIEFEGRSNRLQCVRNQLCPTGQKRNSTSKRLTYAYKNAQQSRFEHGEISTVTPMLYKDVKIKESNKKKALEIISHIFGTKITGIKKWYLENPDPKGGPRYGPLYSMYTEKTNDSIIFHSVEELLNIREVAEQIYYETGVVSSITTEQEKIFKESYKHIIEEEE